MPGVTLKQLQALVTGALQTMQTFLNGVASQPGRNAYNFSGNVTITDNPTLGTKDIAIGSSVSAPVSVALANADVTHSFADGSVFALASGTLTANHSCTVNAGGGAIAGSTITFILKDAGAFTYAIINGGPGGTTLFTKPANLSGRLTVRFDGTNWALQEPPSQYGDATSTLDGLMSAAQSKMLPGALTGATAPARLVGGTASGAPASGTFAVGDLDIDQTGSLWICTAAGTPGTWVNAAVSAPDFAPSGLTGATSASRYVGATTSGAPGSGTFAVGDFVIDRTGKLWICTTAGTPGSWTQVGASSGGAVNMVAAAKVTTDFSTSSGSYVDIGGLSATFTTTGTSTIVARLSGCAGLNTGGDTTFQILLDGSPFTSDGTHTAILRVTNQMAGSGAMVLSLEVEASGVAAGSHTVKVQVKTAAPSVNIRPGSGGTTFESAQLKCMWY